MSYFKIPLGEKAPQIINVVVEIPRGSKNKYEYDEDLDEIKLDRVLHSPVFYPTDYGFIPETRSGDGDHLDALVFVTDPVFSGCFLAARVVGLLKMEDDAGEDYKIITVAEKDPRLKNVQDIEDVNEHSKKEIQHFFEVYKHLEGKWAKVHGWGSKEEAYKIIEESQKTFLQEEKKS